MGKIRQSAWVSALVVTVATYGAVPVSAVDAPPISGATHSQFAGRDINIAGRDNIVGSRVSNLPANDLAAESKFYFSLVVSGARANEPVGIVTSGELSSVVWHPGRGAVGPPATALNATIAVAEETFTDVAVTAFLCTNNVLGEVQVTAPKGASAREVLLTELGTEIVLTQNPQVISGVPMC
ncbi:hypothetical protein [Streptomyces vinaceus]|uniref:hypothetical protein n=1 Tax=Streptomyces vinaceus TaxID=1960 RepID=UPI003826D1CA